MAIAVSGQRDASPRWTHHARGFFARLLRAVAEAPRMGAWTLVARELRGMSRQGQLFWIRVLSGGTGIVALALLLLHEVQVGASLGAQIFIRLNFCLQFTILLVGPVITADCIAQEKREGTLGLLFLAPLTPRDIILGKALSSALKAFTLLLAVMPMMALPVVFGGVPSIWMVSAMAENLSALCIALSAGILASTRYREFIQAAVWAVIYCVLLEAVLGVARIIVASVAMALVGLLGGTPLVIQVWHWGSFAAGPLVMLLVVRYASRTLKARWEAEAADFRPPLWVRLFSESDLWQAILKWDTRKARSANPIAWLQEYSWTARLAKWGWCALALAGEFFVLVLGTASGRDRGWHLLLAAVVVLGISLAGANSFRSERLTGAMELLLVTPLTPARLIIGRLRGIWAHFFPAVAIMVFVWNGTAPLIKGNPAQAWLLISSYLFVPMIGIYLSMFPWHVMVSWLVIFTAGAVVPFVITHPFGATSAPTEQMMICASLQALFGVLSLALLRRKLTLREFNYQNG